MIRFLSTAAFLLGLLAVPPAAFAQEVSPSSIAEAATRPVARLRTAWIAHRLEGDLERAEVGYRGVADDARAAVDLRARAYLGLSILAGDAGDDAAALEALDAAARLPGVSIRWRDAGRALRTRWEGTAAPPTGPPLDFLEELEGQVSHLQREIDRLQGVVAAKEEALAEQAALLERQEEIRREAAASVAAALRREERTERDAEDLLAVISAERRRRELLSRSLIGTHLLAAKHAFERAEFTEAYNEAKKILEIDPGHVEAGKLASHCRLVLAWSAGRDGFDPPEPGLYRGPRHVVLPLATEVMRAHLTRAIHASEAGRTLEAMEAASKVLEEYAYCPFPLPPDELGAIVGTAERILDACMGGSAAEESVQERAARQEQLRLIESLRRDFGKLVAADLTLDRASESPARPAGSDEGAGEGLGWILEEFEEALRAAEAAIGTRRTVEAVGHLRELKLLIEWFPELDREGKVAAQLDLQIAALERSGSGVSDSTDRSSDGAGSVQPQELPPRDEDTPHPPTESPSGD